LPTRTLSRFREASRNIDPIEREKVVMNRVAILLGMGLLLAGSVVKAEDEFVVPRPLNLAPSAAAPACCPAACADHGHSASCWDWLMYHPPHTHCACPCVISSCYPPLHMWFVDMCQDGCGGHCHHAAPERPAPCANKACANKPCVNKACANTGCANKGWNVAPCADQGCPGRSWSLLEWLGLE
jgi:hypothetical protein